MERQLIVSIPTFEKMVSGLIMAGVTFVASETPSGSIKIDFTGGY